MEDEIVPNFRRRQKNGELFFNPMARWDVEYGCSGQGGAIRSVTNSCSDPPAKAEFWIEGPQLWNVIPQAQMAGYPIPFINYGFNPAEINSIGVEASTALLNNRGRSDSNLWETVAELEKTAEMFDKPLSKLSKMVSTIGNAAHKGRAGRLAVAEASALWLQYRYGIKPILADIDNLKTALRNLATRQERRTTRAKVQRFIARFENGVGTDDVFRTNWSCEIRENVVARAMSLDAVERSLSEEFGFGTKGLVTLPWELTSYSFVVDWLLNIGDLFGALVPAGAGWKQLGSCLTMNVVTSNVYRPLSTVSTGSSWDLTRPITGEVHVIQNHKWRQPLEAPGLVIKSDFKLDNVTRAVDALSLAAQQMVSVFGGGTFRGRR